MNPTYVELPLDRTGRNPNNLMSGRQYVATQIGSSPYRILTLEDGGFYEKGLKVFDSNYNRLQLDKDYIVTYYHPQISELFGLGVYSAIVLINPTIDSKVYTTAQLVGSDVAFSFTVKDDYTVYFNSKLAGYKPYSKDYYGNEPVYPPGTLVQLRWHLDTYQPFNNELDRIAKAMSGAIGTHEQDYRGKVVAEHDRILGLLNDRLELHMQDLENPHQDTRYQIGFHLINNFPVATVQEATTEVNNLYLTPALSEHVINIKGRIPLNNHIADKSNIHQVTPKQVDSYISVEVDAKLVPKYNLLEVVENAVNGVFNGVKSYDTILAEYRSNLPAPNFTTGLLAPARLLRGTPSNRSVYSSNYPQWTAWEAIAADYPRGSSGAVYFANTGTNDRGSAHAFVVNTPPFNTAPNNSLVFYKIYETKTRVGSNGGYQFGVTTTYASFKNNVGAWIAV